MPQEKILGGGWDGKRWYFSRKEIEENSPSRIDGVRLKKETYLRKDYCTFLQDLGMKLRVPQVTIATAIIFCHRFYFLQSHAKNDRRTVGPACMFLAGKVEETPRPLKDVILVSYEIIHKKDPAAVQRIKQKEVYEQQKELILLAERVVLATLGFDLNVQHPYKPLVEAIKKFKVAQHALAQVAWNFVNDGLRTSLCLQFKPHHIAAGAIFLAAKFLKVKLPSDGEKVWWQEFDVTPRQLEEVSNQMLELYEQNRVPASQASEADGRTVGGTTERAPSRGSNEEKLANVNTSQAGGSTVAAILKPPQAYVPSEPMDYHGRPPRSTQNHGSEYGSSIVKTPSNQVQGECRVSGPSSHHVDMEDVHDMISGSDWHGGEEKGVSRSREREGTESKDKYRSRNMESKEFAPTHLTPEVVKKFDEDKLKQLREKQNKSHGDIFGRIDSMDEYDPIVKELEEGVELAVAGSEKIKREKKQNRSQPPSRIGNENLCHGKYAENIQDLKGDQVHVMDLENAEEGELSGYESNSSWGYQSPKSIGRKRKAGSSPKRPSDGKHLHSFPEGRNRLSQHGYGDRDHMRQV